MYAKLILRNAKRSAKDYLIYIVTLTLSIGLFYAFLSIASKYYRPDVGAEYNLDLTGDAMQALVLCITSLLVFLVKYVNNFMIRRKQKEFAVQTVIGMEQNTTAWLFFAETLLMGVLSIVLGILLGGLLSQIMNTILLTTYGRAAKISFSLFPDTILITGIFFLIVFCVIGFFNVHYIRKIKVIDMLQADKKTEKDFQKSKWIPGLIIFCVVVSMIAFGQGVINIQTYYDRRLAMPVRIMYWGNIMAPAALLLVVLAYLIFRLAKRPVPLKILVLLLMIFSFPAIYFAMTIVGNTRKYLLPITNDIANAYLFFTGFYLIFIVCSFFYLLSDVISTLKQKSVKIRYKDENLFLFGQILSKLKTTTKTSALICITLALSLVLLILTTALTGWAGGYLEIRSIFDIQVQSQYNNIKEQTDLPKTDYGFLISSLEEKGIAIADECLIQTYFVNREDFYNRHKVDFPVLAVSLSDYNHLRNMLSLESIQLAKDEFVTQWAYTAHEDDISAFLTENQTLSTNGKSLRLADKGYYQANITENLYNSYTDVILILPDEVCSDLLGANISLFINTEQKISYDNAVELETYFNQQMSVADHNTGNETFIRLSTLQVNGTTAAIFIIRTMMTYTAVILLIICFTILSLQQLTDAYDFSYRFDVLRKLGVDDTRMNRLILKQMLIWFGLPVFAAILVAGVIVLYIMQTIYTEVSAYMGMASFLINAGVSMFVLLILFCCYFVSSWILFRRNIPV